jgi:hypothetical protein
MSISSRPESSVDYRQLALEYGLDKPNYSASTLFRILHIGWRHGFAAIRDGSLPASKIGKRWIISSAHAARYMHERMNTASTSEIPLVTEEAPVRDAPRPGRPRRAGARVCKVGDG